MKRLTRRSLVVAAAAASTGLCVCGLNEGCATLTKKGKTLRLAPEAYTVEGHTLSVLLPRAPSLNAVGGAVKVIDARLPTPLIIARTGAADYAAVSLLCPHRGVEVEYRHEQRRFRCASLGHSTFGEDGALQKGFANTGLTRFGVSLDPADNKRLLITY